MAGDEATHQRWAHLRFSIVGPLLAAPPARGELQAELERLAAKEWLHPKTCR
jgi:putative transposase